MDLAEMKTVLSAPEFDATAFLAAKAVKDATVLLAAVTDTIKSVDASIYQHVASHYTDLLKMATEVDNLHGVLQLVENKVVQLSQTMEKVKRKLDSPFHSLQANILLLRRLQVTTDLLRKIVRTSTLIKRIQARSVDITKQSAYVNELESLFSTMDWEGIHLLESYKRITDHSREDMVNQAWGLINASFETADQLQLGFGLQIAQNLGLLADVVFKLISRWQTEFDSTLSSALDVKALTQRARTRQPNTTSAAGPGRAAASTIGGQAAAFYVSLWTSLDGLIDKLDSLSSFCRLLGSTLIKYETSHGVFDVAPIVQFGQQRTGPHPSLAELLVHQVLANWHESCRNEHTASVALLFSSTGYSTMKLSPAIDSMSQADSVDWQSHLTSLDSQLQSDNGFIGWAFRQLENKLSTVVKQSSQIKEALDGEYPKLLKLMLDLARRQAHLDRSSSQKTSDASCFFALPDYMVRTLKPFETAYLSRSLSRLFDQVSMAFSNQGTIDSSAIDGLVQSAVNELAFATVHCDLLFKVSRNVAKMIALFTSKVENLVSVGPSAIQLTNVRNADQENNIKLINLLCAFGRQLEIGCNRRLRNLPVLRESMDSTLSASSPFSLINEALQSRLNVLCLNIAQPLLQAVGGQIEEMLSTMHSECFTPTEDDAKHNPNSCSIYLKQLQDFITHVRRQYFSILSQPSSTLPPASLSIYLSENRKLATKNEGHLSSFVCGELALQVALAPFLTRWIDSFLYNVSLVRPVNELGRFRLATDCVEFELALAPMLSPSLGTSLSNLVPKAYKRLKALRPILLAESENIVGIFADGTGEQHHSSLETTTELPPSIICQHLFSRAPDEMRPPHESVNWSTEKYITWAMARTSEADRLGFLRNGLSAYAREVQKRQQREYAPMYVLIKKFLSSLDDEGNMIAGKNAMKTS